MLYIFARFEPRSGQQLRLRNELTLLLEPTRAEAGCIRIHLFESTRDPVVFFIHSEWVDERAFEAHGELQHVKRFLGLVGELIVNPFEARRTKQIG